MMLDTSTIESSSKHEIAPQFKEKIEELKAKGVHSTDPVVFSLFSTNGFNTNASYAFP